MARTFQVYNGAAPTTAAGSKVATGTSIKTMLQVAATSTQNLRIREWGISFDGSAAATPIQVELIETDVGATITQYGSGDIVKVNDPDGLASGIDISSTTKSGYTSTSEGSIAAVRVLDYQLVAPTNQYLKQLPLGDELVVRASKFLRIRVTAGASVGCWCYVRWEES